MKKILTTLLFMSLLCIGNCASWAHCYPHDCCDDPPPPPPPVVVRVDHYTDSSYFSGCDEHILETYTAIEYYSDGSERRHNTYSIFDKNGSIIADGLYYAYHVITDSNNHYFVVRPYGGDYMILRKDGSYVDKSYKDISYIGNSKLLVKEKSGFLDYKYGIINYEHKEIVPIKYDSLKYSNGLFISKLNGYYGLLDEDGNIYAKCDNDKISVLENVFVLKYGKKYGMVSFEGKTILDTSYDKISKEDGYIKFKKDDFWGLADRDGNIIAEAKYRKVRIYRNTPQVYYSNSWHDVGCSL